MRFQPVAGQMRRTLASLMPTAAAMLRVLQWVAFAGCRRVVMITTRFLRRALMLGLGRRARLLQSTTPSATSACAIGKPSWRDGHDGGDFLVLVARGREQYDASALRHPHREGWLRA